VLGRRKMNLLKSVQSSHTFDFEQARGGVARAWGHGPFLLCILLCKILMRFRLTTGIEDAEMPYLHSKGPAPTIVPLHQDATAPVTIPGEGAAEPKGLRSETCALGDVTPADLRVCRPNSPPPLSGSHGTPSGRLRCAPAGYTESLLLLRESVHLLLRVFKIIDYPPLIPVHIPPIT